MNKHKYLSFFLILCGGIVLATLFLWSATNNAQAQCGSQASSCKNCHEVQAEYPVNNDGTSWHTPHAFGDFCYICHAGNNQAMDKVEAHTGMVPPLSDIKASCMQCHPNDLQERAQVYATALGVEIGAGATDPNDGGATPIAQQPAAEISAPIVTELDFDDPNLVDYVQRYNEIVLGKRPINVGNTILISLIGLVAVGGGGFVVYNEFLSKSSFWKMKNLEFEYPEDVIDMLPVLANLTPQSRKSLQNILENPQKTETMLNLMDKLTSDEKSGE
jgi:hypothetical protein